MSATSGVRPTKGYLMETKRRIQTIERGTEFLKLKRDRKIRNKTELTRLQRQFDACATGIRKMENSKLLLKKIRKKK